MKRLLGICMALLIVSAAYPQQNAEYDWQEYRHCLSVGGGYMSGVYPMKTLIITIASNIGDNGGQVQYYGSYGLQYHYQALWWLRAGAKLSYEGDGYSFYPRDDEAKISAIGQTAEHFAGVMASCQFTYMNREHVKLYSGVDFGLGMYILDKRYNEGYTDSDGNARITQCAFLPAFNLTAFGVSFGSARVYGLAEINLGYEAMLKLGIGCNL